MPELKINDEVRLQYGPYRTTGTVVRIIDAGAVVRPAGVASLVGNDTALATPNGIQLTLDPSEDFIGRAHWGSTILRGSDPHVEALPTTLHHPVRVVGPGECADENCDHEDLEQCLAATGVEVCAECLRIAELAAGDPDRVRLNPILWPCPTAEAAAVASATKAVALTKGRLTVLAQHLLTLWAEEQREFFNITSRETLAYKLAKARLLECRTTLTIAGLGATEMAIWFDIQAALDIAGTHWNGSAGARISSRWLDRATAELVTIWLA